MYRIKNANRRRVFKKLYCNELSHKKYMFKQRYKAKNGQIVIDNLGL